MSATIKLLTADDILNAKDVKIEFVEVPEWKGGVYVREFSALAREQYEELLSPGDDEGEDAKPDTRNIRARVVALAACDADGKALFTVEQAVRLGDKNSVAIGRVWDVAAKLNKLRRIDREGEKKESAGPRSGDSGTA